MADSITQQVYSGTILKEKENDNSETKSADINVEKMTVDDMRTKFPELVRAGQFVAAMEIIQGHGRFNWFYALLEKVSTCLSRVGEAWNRPPRTGKDNIIWYPENFGRKRPSRKHKDAYSA